MVKNERQPLNQRNTKTNPTSHNHITRKQKTTRQLKAVNNMQKKEEKTYYGGIAWFLMSKKISQQNKVFRLDDDLAVCLHSHTKQKTLPRGDT